MSTVHLNSKYRLRLKSSAAQENEIAMTAAATTRMTRTTKRMKKTTATLLSVQPIVAAPRWPVASVVALVWVAVYPGCLAECLAECQVGCQAEWEECQAGWERWVEWVVGCLQEWVGWAALPPTLATILTSKPSWPAWALAEVEVDGKATLLGWALPLPLSISRTAAYLWAGVPALLPPPPKLLRWGGQLRGMVALSRVLRMGTLATGERASGACAVTDLETTMKIEVAGMVVLAAAAAAWVEEWAG